MARWLSLFLLVALLPAGCGGGRKQLHVFIWSEYLDPEVIVEFERRFDCRVVFDYYDSPEAMSAKLSAGGAARYDIVVPSDNTLPALVQSGLLSPLRHENIPNLGNLDPEFRNPAFDPGNRHGIPYQWGTSGLYIRAPRGVALDESWGLIFDPAKQPGPFLMIEDVRSCIGAALQYKGYSFNSTNLAELAEARDLLVRAKVRSLGFEGSVGCKNRILARGAVLGMAYSGEAVRGAREDPETRYFVPREGGEMWLDCLSIPSKAPHRELAEAFINFILEPKVGAQLANFNRLATPNREALPWIHPADLKDPAIYPPAEIRRRLEFARDLGDKTRLYDELWTQIKGR